MYLEMDQIKKSFGETNSRTQVLHGITCGVEAGDICVLLGPSGSGKSTLLNIIGGIETIDSGSLTINGETLLEAGETGRGRGQEDRGTGEPLRGREQESHGRGAIPQDIREPLRGSEKRRPSRRGKRRDLFGADEKRLSKYRRDHLGYVFQAYNLIPNLTAKENIEVGAYLSDDPLDLEELLKTLGLSEHRNKLPSQMSGGQQQRTAIGRAIIKKPDILLCDEPTGALDYGTSKEILTLIEDVNEKYGTTVILVTHNDALRDMADQVIRLRDGQIIEDRRNEKKIPAADLEW